MRSYRRLSPVRRRKGARPAASGSTATIGCRVRRKVSARTSPNFFSAHSRDANPGLTKASTDRCSPRNGQLANLIRLYVRRRRKRIEPIQVVSNEDFRKLVGKKLRTLRREAGISQRDLAKRLNLSHQQIQKYERGSNTLPLRRVTAFASALGVAPAVLVFPEIDTTAIGSAVGLSPEQTELLRLFEEIPDRESRKRLLDLLHTVKNFANSLL